MQTHESDRCFTESQPNFQSQNQSSQKVQKQKLKNNLPETKEKLRLYL